MAGGGDSSSAISLEHTPTWALAVVCFVFISMSLAIEHFIHLLTNWLKKHRRTALCEAVEKLKSELMLVGFISLLLAATQGRISKICVSTQAAEIMLPCRKQNDIQLAVVNHYEHLVISKMMGRILADDDESNSTSDSGAVASDSCSEQGKVALMTQDGIHQLHIFIFVLALMHIVYSVLTIALGRAKMRRWKAWENETQTTEYEVANDPNRFRFARQTTFGRRHMTSKSTLHLWIKCFFRQFFHSVAKVDYLTLRHGFISAHFSSSGGNSFDFQKYIQRSLDEDFKSVVGISPLMWFVVVILLLLDVYGWNVFVSLSYIPLFIVLIVGAKLEVIVERMALQIKDLNSVIIGAPLVKPSDKLFWFGYPKLVLVLLHYTLFVNAFELAFFIWATIQFGYGTCFNEQTASIIVRLVLAITVQFLCTYITLPLYALVTQMGSEFKRKAMEDQMTKIIKQWHADVRERRKQERLLIQTPRTSLSTEFSVGMNSPRLATNENTHLPISGEISEVHEEEIKAEEEEGEKEEYEDGSFRGISRVLTLERLGG